MHILNINKRKKGVLTMGKFTIGLTAGVLLGTAASILTIPQLDRRTRRTMNSVSKRFTNRAESMIDGMLSYRR